MGLSSSTVRAMIIRPYDLFDEIKEDVEKTCTRSFEPLELIFTPDEYEFFCVLLDDRKVHPKGFLYPTRTNGGIEVYTNFGIIRLMRHMKVYEETPVM